MYLEKNERTEKIIQCHKGIAQSAKQALEYAIEAGRLLSEQKAELKHGDFEAWIKTYMPFNTVTAWRYAKLYHHNKSLNAKDLQEAYKQIEQIERENNKTEQRKSFERVKEYRKTGIKPEGWKRGTDDKKAKEESERDERIAEMKRRMAEKEQRREQIESERENRQSNINEMLDQLNKQAELKAAFREKIGLTGDNAFHDFNNLLMNYLETLTTNGQKIEACHNIIKICKGVVNSLQQESIQGDLI